MSNIIDVVNVIRENASQEYQDRIPVATQENISSVSSPLLSETIFLNAFMNSLVHKIIFQIVQNKLLVNPLAALKKGTKPLGDGIEEIFTNPAKDTGYDGTGSKLLTKTKPDTYTLYHHLNRTGQYPLSVSRQQLKTAFTSYDTMDKYISSLVSSLYSGDSIDEFILTKNLIAESIIANEIKTVLVSPVTSGDTGKAFIKAVKNASLFMTFPGSNFNKFKEIQAAQSVPKVVNPIITMTPTENQVLLIRADILTEVDVDVLAMAFNMDKANFITRMIPVDSFGKASNCLGLLCDESLFQIYDDLNEMTDFQNGQGLFWNYWWNHWQTYSLSYFANAVAFCTYGEVPAGSPTTAAFTDSDVTAGEIAGDLTWAAPASEADILGYKVYFLNNSNVKVGVSVGSIDKDSDYSYTFASNTAIPATATQLAVFSYNEYGENTTPAKVTITDAGA